MDRREFLLAAASGAMLSGASQAFAGARLDGEARRMGASAVRLSWTEPGRPTSIYLSSDPDAQPPYMRAIRSGARGGRADLALPVSPRPYFLLRTAGGGQTRVAERLLPLQGGRNFRDLGGYRAADGRQVRWGRIYRSGAMNALTPTDLSYLSELGLQVVCDLRSLGERRAAPSPFGAAEAPAVVATDYDLPSFAALVRATTRAEAIQAFADAYVGFTEALTPQYADLFARLLRRETPIAFNCSAGKDRTGMGAALILSVLGVPRQTVVADYALTQVYLPPATFAGQIARGGALAGVSPTQAQFLARMPREVVEVMAGSDPGIMRQALAVIDQRHGGPVELAKARYGLTDAKIAYLRGVYLI